MKRTAFRNMLIMLLTATFIFSIGILTVISSSIPAEPHNANAIWIEPSTVLTPHVGERFNVTVWVNMSEPTYVWQVKMYWNNTYLNLTRIDYTGTGKSQFFSEHTTFPQTPLIDYYNGWVRHEEPLVGDDQKDPGYGSLFWTEFELIEHPEGNILEALNINNHDTFFLDANFSLLTCHKHCADLIRNIDIAVTNIKPSLPSVAQGLNLRINVTIENRGVTTETFNVTTYSRSDMIDTVIQNLTITLESQVSTISTFIWDTTNSTKGNYTIIAVADSLPGEIDTTNNEFIDEWVLVTMVGDITGPDSWPDGKVDMRDVGQAALAFGSYPGHPRWDQKADITGITPLVPDDRIDMRDMALIARHFGEIDP